MRRALGAALTGAALVACRPTAPSGLTLLFLGRAPAAPLDGLSWAPDPDASSIAAFDRDLRVVKRFTSPRLATPPAVATLDGRYLLVTERTGEGGVFAPAGRPGRGLPARDAEPELVPGKGRSFGARYAIVNVALALGPGGRLYALGSDDSAGTKLRVDVVDTASGAIVATRHLRPRESAVAADPTGRLAVLDADTLLAGRAAPQREPFAPPFTLPTPRGDTVTLADYAGKVTLVNFWAS